MLCRLPGIDIPASLCPQPGNLSCSPRWSRCLAVQETVSVAQHILEVQVPLVGAVEQPRCHHSTLCAAGGCLGLLHTCATGIKRGMHQPQRPMTWFLRRCMGSSSVVQAGDAGELAHGRALRAVAQLGVVLRRSRLRRPASRTRDFFPRAFRGRPWPAWGPAGARAHRHFVAGWRARVEAPCRWVQAAGDSFRWVVGDTIYRLCLS